MARYIVVIGFVVIFFNENKSMTIDERIKGGLVGDIRGFEHFARIIGWARDQNNGSKLIKRDLCSGSIIHENWVLTTAYCIKILTNIPKEKSYLLVGSDKSSDKFTVKSNSENYYEYEELYIFNNNTNDDYRLHNIGLIKTTRPIKFGERVKKILLPKKNEQLQVDLDAIVTGLGVSKYPYEEEDYNNEIRVYIAETRDSYLCLQQFDVSIKMKFYCTSYYEGNGKPGRPCEGDQGMPLVDFVNNQPPLVLLGLLTNFHPDCILRNPSYSIFIQVSPYVEEINCMINS